MCTVRLLDIRGKLCSAAQTVVPKLGGAVLVVNGPQVGSTGYLERVDTDKFCGSVRIDGRVVDGIPYEDFCKLDG